MRFSIFILAMVVSFNLDAQTTAAPASIVLEKAVTEATVKNKKVLLMFHASWCGWCHKMDNALNDISCKKYFDDNFVITHITVLESKGKQNLENPGGLEMMEKFNGKEQGLPYWVILDKDGYLLFDSQVRKPQADGSIKGQNVGCPASQPEVDHFISILKKTTSLNAAELATIAKRFRLNEQ